MKNKSTILIFLFISAALGTLFLFLPSHWVSPADFTVVISFAAVVFWAFIEPKKEKEPLAELARISGLALAGCVPGLAVVIAFHVLTTGQPMNWNQLLSIPFNVVPGLLVLSSLRALLQKLTGKRTIRDISVFLLLAGSFWFTWMQCCSGRLNAYYNLFTGKLTLKFARSVHTGLIGDWLFIYNRLLILIVGLSILALLAKNWSRTVRTVVHLSAVSVIIFAALNPLLFGMGHSIDKIKMYLTESFETEHFTVNYIPGALTERQIEFVKDELEWEYFRTLKILDRELKRHVYVYLVSLSDTEAAEKGLWRSSCAGPNRIYIRNEAWRIFSRLGSLRHEMIHTLDLGLGGSWFHREGLAVAIDDYQYRGPEFHEQEAVLLREGHLPPVESFYSHLGFRLTNVYYAYQFSGSFTGFLMHNYGIEKFKDLMSRNDWEDVYGKSLDVLEAEWHDFLRKCPVEENSVESTVDGYLATEHGKRRDGSKTHGKDVDFEYQDRLIKLMKEEKYQEILDITGDLDGGFNVMYRALALRNMGRLEDALASMKDTHMEVSIPALNILLDMERWDESIEMLDRLKAHSFLAKINAIDLMKVILSCDQSREVFVRAMRSGEVEKLRILEGEVERESIFSYLATMVKLFSDQKKTAKENTYPLYHIPFMRIVQLGEDEDFHEIYQSFRPFLERTEGFVETKRNLYLILGSQACLAGDPDATEECFEKLFELGGTPQELAEAEDWLARTEWLKNRIIE